MTATRTSNKQILDAIERLTDTIANAMVPQPQNQVSATPNEAPPMVEPNTTSEITVDKSYLSHVEDKVATKCNDDGETRVLYARRNQRGETKLAYCLASRFPALKDRGMIGAIKTVAPKTE